WKNKSWSCAFIGVPCFNPSYTGYATGSIRRIHQGIRNAEFQSFLYWICYWKIYLMLAVILVVLVSILLILDMLLEDSTLSLIAYVYVLFQSFLYWICYWKRQSVRMSPQNTPSFNPSYTGYATGRTSEASR